MAVYKFKRIVSSHASDRQILPNPPPILPKQENPAAGESKTQRQRRPGQSKPHQEFTTKENELMEEPKMNQRAKKLAKPPQPVKTTACEIATCQSNADESMPLLLKAVPAQATSTQKPWQRPRPIRHLIPHQKHLPTIRYPKRHLVDRKRHGRRRHGAIVAISCYRRLLNPPSRKQQQSQTIQEMQERTSTEGGFQPC
jgi:hypothetical protein